MRKLFRIVLPCLLVLPASAQSPGFSASGGFIVALNSLKKAPHNDFGYLLGIDYEGNVSGTDVPARAGIMLASLPGREQFGLKTSLTLAQLHGDVFIGTGAKGLRGFAGLSLNSYSMSKSGEENTTDALDVDHHFPVRDAKGLKLGLRLGLQFTSSERWAFELAYQQTELAGKDLQDPLVRQGGINPGWAQVLVSYHF